MTDNTMRAAARRCATRCRKGDPIAQLLAVAVHAGMGLTKHVLKSLSSLTAAGLIFCLVMAPTNSAGQSGPASSTRVGRPRIIYTSPRVVSYQLGRLSNEQLVLVERYPEDPRFRPVYEAILARPGLAPPYRDEAVMALRTLNKSSLIVEWIAAIQRLDRLAGPPSSVFPELAARLAASPPDHLKLNRGLLLQAEAGARHAWTRRAFAAAIVVGDGNWDLAWAAAETDDEALISLIGAVPMIHNAKLQQAIYARLATLLDRPGDGRLRDVAIDSLTHIPGHDGQTFAMLARLIQNDRGREVAIISIRRLEKAAWPDASIGPLADSLITFLKSMPVAQRDSRLFLESTALGFDLAEKLPEPRAGRLRKVLHHLGIATFLIKTIEHQMRYDRTQIVVESGRHVSIVLENDDMMPHNLVIVQPGAHEEIGTVAEAMATRPDAQDRGYIPASSKILWATQLLPPGGKEKLSFVAPHQTGVYPYLCTYPGHWRRMFGALIVVADLEQYRADPKAYLVKYPLAIRDELLKYNRRRTPWTFEQLEPYLEGLIANRSFVRARELFRVANCVACHRFGGEGHSFGPDLANLDPKLGPGGILNEILNPSKKINDKFRSVSFMLESGKIVSGLIMQETAEEVQLLENPMANSRPIKIRKPQIEARSESTTSIMPAGLLDPFTPEEILDLLAYLVSRGDRHSELFSNSPHHHEDRLKKIGY